MTEIIDIHCHVDATTSGAIARARAAGVVHAVCNSATPDDWGRIIDITKNCDFMSGAIGVHPWCAGDLGENWDADLARLLDNNPELMIGEIGIDKHYPDIDTQTDTFARQMALAHQLSRPVQIHCVGAWQRVMHILAHSKLPPVIIMHSYNAGPEITDALLRHENVYFSYGPRNMTMSERAIAAMCDVPDTRILIESDGDNPADARRVLNWLASTRDTDADAFGAILYQNSTTVINHG